MDEGWDDAAGSGPSPVEQSVLLEALRQIQGLADFVGAAELWQHSAEQSVEAVRESAIAVRKVQSAHLAAVADLDSRRGALSGTAAGYGGRSYLRHQLRRTTSQAKADLAAAAALRPCADPADGGMPQLGQAFAQGEVSREHVDAALRIIGQLPKKVLAAPMRDEQGAPLLNAAGQPMCGGDVLDERITRHAREYDSHALAALAAQLKDAIDPDGRFDPESCLKRGLRLRWDGEGMLVLRGELDPAAGALFMAVIDHVSAPRTRDAQAEHPAGPRDQRTSSQRNADGLMDIVKAAQASGALGLRGGDSPRITLITSPGDLAAAVRAAGAEAAAGAGAFSAEGAAGTETSAPRAGRVEAADRDPGSPADWRAGAFGDVFRPASARAPRDEHGQGIGCDGPVAGDGAWLGTGTRVSPRLLARFACDAVLQRALLAPSGAILDLGREERTITAAQRRALHARDRGCVIPGCTVPAAWTEGHHVRWWSDEGPTDIGNLALLCGRHHTEVHAGAWALLMQDGLPWAIPPDWLDPEQKPTRNTYHQHVQQLRVLGLQLRLNLPPPDQGAA